MVNKERVLLGMSGGVDSSVAAYILQRQGYHVIGATMQIYDGDGVGLSEKKTGCYGPAAFEGIAAARRIAQQLKIEHHVIPLVDEYRREVLDYFKSEYLKGRTPNPCVRCNQILKFGFMLSKAREFGISFDLFATGHYNRLLKRATGRISLMRATDTTKDQSYFLSRLKQDQLKDLLFPLGELTKQEVKKIALEIGWQELVTQRESQDFIAADSYSILFNPEDGVAGKIKNSVGEVIGEHKGLINYTIGQRRGVGLGGGGKPLYVTGIDIKNNVLTVGSKEELFAEGCYISDLNWIGLDDLPTEPLEVSVKIRQTAKPAAATVYLERGETIAKVHFKEPQLAVTPGQVAVLYKEDLVVGSGIIEDQTLK